MVTFSLTTALSYAIASYAIGIPIAVPSIRFCYRCSA